ncbi:MAG: TIGR02449 family protein [Gammaproteobacteria bacterium]|nr:TIGR02449 family protein [Gammaproteobacteria bacterium]
MKTVELNHLETQVDHLMHLIETLQFENVSLRQKMAVHIKERTRLQYKNQRASKQVKQIIKNIKEELS